jgi:hypothetical protein
MWRVRCRLSPHVDWIAYAPELYMRPLPTASRKLSRQVPLRSRCNVALRQRTGPKPYASVSDGAADKNNGTSEIKV